MSEEQTTETELPSRKIQVSIDNDREKETLKEENEKLKATLETLAIEEFEKKKEELHSKYPQFSDVIEDTINDVNDLEKFERMAEKMPTTDGEHKPHENSGVVPFRQQGDRDSDSILKRSYENDQVLRAVEDLEKAKMPNEANALLKIAQKRAATDLIEKTCSGRLNVVIESLEDPLLHYDKSDNFTVKKPRLIKEGLI